MILLNNALLNPLFGQAPPSDYPMSITIALIIICLVIVAILWLPGIIGKD